MLHVNAPKINQITLSAGVYLFLLAVYLFLLARRSVSRDNAILGGSRVAYAKRWYHVL